MERAESTYNMFDWWKKVIFKNYANFSGRARRAEFWYFSLVNTLFIILLYIVSIASIFSGTLIIPFLAFIFCIVVALVTFIPRLAVIVRRLHDINKSGWNYFMVLIPLAGPIILLVWLFTDGDRCDNNYGPDPKNEYNPEFDFEQR
jgi:uncharacterized membrane protein YhaH (DUF805 family)